MIFETVTYTPIPTADYSALVRAFEPTTGQYGAQVKWTLALGDVENVDGDVEEDKTIWYFTPTEVSSKNKLGKLAAACGFDITAGIPLTSELIVGKRVIITVVVASREDGTPTNKITDVRRAPAKGAKAAKPPTIVDGVEYVGDDPF